MDEKKLQDETLEDVPGGTPPRVSTGSGSWWRCNDCGYSVPAMSQKTAQDAHNARKLVCHGTMEWEKFYVL